MSKSRNLSESFIKRVQLELGAPKHINFYLTQNSLQIQAALNPYLLAYDHLPASIETSMVRIYFYYESIDVKFHV